MVNRDHVSQKAASIVNTLATLNFVINEVHIWPSETLQESLSKGKIH